MFVAMDVMRIPSLKDISGSFWMFSVEKTPETTRFFSETSMKPLRFLVASDELNQSVVLGAR